jgi:hypothetical protein
MLIWGPHQWDGHGWQASTASRRKANQAMIRKLDLAASQYVAGGWLLQVRDHAGMRCVVGGFQVADEMPNCEEVQGNGHQIVIQHNDKGETRIRLYFNGVEAPAGYSGPAGSWIGVGLIGR